MLGLCILNYPFETNVGMIDHKQGSPTQVIITKVNDVRAINNIVNNNTSILFCHLIFFRLRSVKERKKLKH